MEWSETLLREADCLKEPRGKVAELLGAHCHGLQKGARWPQSYVFLEMTRKGMVGKEMDQLNCGYDLICLFLSLEISGGHGINDTPRASNTLKEHLTLVTKALS